MGRYVKAGELEIWTEQVGDGPDVLLIGGLGDTVESWQFQLDGLADRYRMTAFDNRGAGRTAMPDGSADRRGDGGRRGRGAAGPRRPLGACRRVLRRQHHRPGTRSPAPGAGPKPGAAEHLARNGRST